MVISKKAKRCTTFIAIGFLCITLALAIFFGEKHLRKRQKEIYEGCKNVIVTPRYKLIVEKDY